MTETETKPKAVQTEEKLRETPEKIDVASLRANGPAVGVDQMTRRSDADALFGHFVSIDLSNDKAKKAVEALIGEGNARFGNGDYGVFVEVGETDRNGYPVTATVWLRDDNAVQVPGIPYEALSPAQAGRR